MKRDDEDTVVWLVLFIAVMFWPIYVPWFALGFYAPWFALGCL